MSRFLLAPALVVATMLGLPPSTVGEGLPSETQALIWKYRQDAGVDRSVVEENLTREIWSYHISAVESYLDGDGEVSEGEMVASAMALDAITGIGFTDAHGALVGTFSNRELSQGLRMWSRWYSANEEDLYFESLTGLPLKRMLCSEEHFPDAPNREQLKELPVLSISFTRSGHSVRYLAFASGILRIERLGYRIWCSYAEPQNVKELASALGRVVRSSSSVGSPSGAVFVSAQVGDDYAVFEEFETLDTDIVAPLAELFRVSGFPDPLLTHLHAHWHRCAE